MRTSCPQARYATALAAILFWQGPGVAAGGAATVLTVGAGQSDVAVQHVRDWVCPSCEGPERLSTIRSLAVGLDGSVFAVDEYEPFVRVWSQSGERRGWFLGQGEGPDEMQRPGYLSIHDAETVSLIDSSMRRWTILEVTGDVVRTIRLTGFPTQAAYDPPRQRLLYVITSRLGPCNPPEVMEASVIDGTPKRVTILEDVPLSRYNCAQDVYSFDVGPDGRFAVGFPWPDYVLREYASDGALVREIRHVSSRARKSDEQVAAEQASRQRSRIPGVTQPDRNVDPLHSHFYGDALRYDGDGRLWIKTPRGGSNETIFDVFQDGELVAAVAVPRSSQLKGHTFDVSGDFLLLASEDAATNPVLCLYRVIWP